MWIVYEFHQIKKKLDTLTEKNAQDILEIEDWHGQLSIDKMMFERFTKEYTEKSRKASDSFLPQSFSLSSLGKKKKSTEENSAGSWSVSNFKCISGVIVIVEGKCNVHS